MSGLRYPDGSPDFIGDSVMGMPDGEGGFIPEEDWEPHWRWGGPTETPVEPVNGVALGVLVAAPFGILFWLSVGALVARFT